ncbi:ABC transporter permease [Umezawaea endophytica]|uniref:ABC transporter permease n=1 Tax=Umezawaea endophytica TaxID=1654476 RepID=A0A9X2VX81_9PSEU|nr:ABC transporter permease [Umezawaea endophytica]MCS7483353.1 ABC transporter permease [Umezawaea endophytica]
MSTVVSRPDPGTASAAREGAAVTGGFVGTGALVRLALRRDRVLLPGWIAGIVLLAVGSAAAAADLYSTVESRVASATAANNTTALVALYGRVYDPSSEGGISMVKTGGLGAVMIALLSIIVVVRHTRAEEESGRLELVGATVVGRYAPLTSALIVAIGTNAVLALLTAVGVAGAGMPMAGSFAFGLAWGGVGIAFAGIAATTAQVSSTARGATSLAAIVLGFVYVLRAVGDTAGPDGPTWMSWLSPIGWGQQFRPYSGDRWWVLLVLLGFAAVVVMGAFALVERRDIGAGLVADRLGPAGSTRLGSTLALAWRLHRGSLFGWTAAFAGLGLVLGNIAGNVGGFVDSPSAREMVAKLGGTDALTDAFISAEMGVMGLVASIYGIQAALRLRTEETGQRAEPLLAAAVSRTRWAWSHLAIAFGGPVLLVAATGAGAGLSHGASSGDMSRFGPVFASALLQVPAVWVLTGIVVLAFGAAPRLVATGWVALVVFLLLGQLGPLLELDQWAMDLSPYTHIPRFPAGDVDPVPLVWLVLIAAALVAAGLTAFRRRDITT